MLVELPAYFWFNRYTSSARVPTSLRLRANPTAPLGVPCQRRFAGTNRDGQGIALEAISHVEDAATARPRAHKLQILILRECAAGPFCRSWSEMLRSPALTSTRWFSSRKSHALVAIIDPRIHDRTPGPKLLNLTTFTTTSNNNNNNKNKKS